MKDLPPVDYCNALESARYWRRAFDLAVYQEKKFSYLQQVKRRKFRMQVEHAAESVKGMFGAGSESTNAPSFLKDIPIETREGAASLMNSDIFAQIMSTVVDAMADEGSSESNGLSESDRVVSSMNRMLMILMTPDTLQKLSASVQQNRNVDSRDVDEKNIAQDSNGNVEEQDDDERNNHQNDTEKQEKSEEK
jgi:hypothetical protein